MKAPAGLAVVLPIRSFSAAKTRLAGALTDAQRRALALHCAARVLEASQPLTTVVVCDDPEVAEWAQANGAIVVSPRTTGLNEAAAAGRAAARERGFERVLVVHADLPHAEPLAPLAETTTAVVIVPDRHHDGTNALLVPTEGDFQFRYGLGSCTAHTGEADRLGLSWRIVPRSDLALDLDTIDDLRAAGLDASSLPQSPWRGSAE